MEETQRNKVNRQSMTRLKNFSYLPHINQVDIQRVPRNLQIIFALPESELQIALRIQWSQAATRSDSQGDFRVLSYFFKL